MNSLALKIWCSVLLAAVTAYGGWTWWKWYGSTQESRLALATADEAYRLVIDSDPPLEEFTLTERSGREFDSASMNGKVWIASFFFTSCPGDCLTLNRRIAELHEELAASEVTFVSISCDPATDTPEVMSKYADHFKADPDRWLFLTGDLAYVVRVANDVFNVAVATKTHTDRMILVDRDGRNVGTYRATVDAEMAGLRRNLDKLLTVNAADTKTGGDAPAQAEPAADQS